MNNFTKEDIIRYADKLLIGLTSDEVDLILSEFKNIDESINLLNKIEGLGSADTMDYCLDDQTYEFRSDDEYHNENVILLLQNAREKTRNEVIVPKVV